MQLLGDTVDGRNPAPVDMENVPLFTEFSTFQVVVWDFWTINSILLLRYLFDCFMIVSWLLPTWRQSRDELLFANLAANAQKNLVDFSPLVP